MEKSFIEDLRETKRREEEGYVHIYNTGKVSTFSNDYFEKISGYRDNSVSGIEYNFHGVAGVNARDYFFDSIVLSLEVAIVFKKEQINEDNTIKGFSTPFNNLVHYQVIDSSIYLDNEKVESRYDGCSATSSGYVDYNEFVKKLEEDGIVFDGPKTYEELMLGIVSGKKFNINLIANLIEKEEPKKLVRK